MSTTATNESGPTRQYLTFICAGEEYGLDILRVQEIKGWEPVTAVPHSAPHMLGMLNLRGTVVPVMELRARFGLERRPFDGATVVIMVRVQGAGDDHTVGMVVDAVSEVYTISTADIKPAPSLGGRADSACLCGVCMVDGKLVMLLDVDRLLDGIHQVQAA